MATHCNVFPTQSIATDRTLELLTIISGESYISQPHFLRYRSGHCRTNRGGPIPTDSEFRYTEAVLFKNLEAVWFMLGL